MASFITLYNEIECKIKNAAVFIEEKKIENNKLKKIINEQNNKIEQIEKELESLKEKNKIVTITNTVLFKKDKQETIKKINDLVREIDNTIGLLNRMEWKREG